MSFYCHQCGGALPAGARFCSRCGSVVAGTAPMPGRQLFRPIMGRMIAGVCIGVAQTYGWDVALVRVLTVIGLFCSGGLVAVAYLAGWIGIPEEPYPMPGMYPPPGSGMYPPPGPGAYPPAGPGGVSS